MKRILILLLIPTIMLAELRLKTSGNKRYFVLKSDTTKAIYLAGSHTWATMQDQGPNNACPPDAFNITQFANMMQANGQNFTRMMVWEQPRRGTWTADVNYCISPTIWTRTGPGNASDGSLKFNLDSVNLAYISRARARVDTFAQRGIYVMFQLFQGWSINSMGMAGNPWTDHPMVNGNNINSINGDPGATGNGNSTQILGAVANLWAYQVKYIKTMIDSLNEFDNLIWGTVNESPGLDNAWEDAIVDTVHAYELRKPKQHPIGRSGDWNIVNATVFASASDWVSTGQGTNGTIWETAPPDSGGRKVVINDTDHLWGNIGFTLQTNVDWVWHTFCRGNNALFMDGYDGKSYGTGHPFSQSDSSNAATLALRQALGVTRWFADSLCRNLLTMIPSFISSTSDYEMASTHEVVVYQTSGTVTVDLSTIADSVNVMWIAPNTYPVDHAAGTKTAGGASRNFSAPDAKYDVLYLYTDAPATFVNRILVR